MLVGLLALLLSLPAQARDIDYTAEHVPESAMNNRYLTLPYAAGDRDLVVAPGYSATSGGVIRLKGLLLAAAWGCPLGKDWTLRTVAFYDRLRFSGGSGSELFHPLFSNSIPLDLPATADFSQARGEMSHWGLGPALDRRFPRGWTLTAGALWERLDLRGYRIDYTLTSGADAGKSGVLDHSARYDYVTPFFALQVERELGSQLSVVPRLIAGMPLPKQPWVGRITGPGFDVRGDTGKAGYGHHMGDPFSGFGLALRHASSGLSLDIGVSVYQALFEGKLTHKGISRDLVLSAAWTHRV